MPAMPTPRRIDLSREDPVAALAAAGEALARGELVVVPTETVYGLAAREDRPEALERLARLKAGRLQPYSLAVADPRVLGERLAPFPRVARRIAGRWWPGPVTLVLPTRDGRSLGVRVPGHPFVRDLARSAGSPLLLPSANRPGAPPPRTVAELDPSLLPQVALVVDGGRTALGEASTVVRPARACLHVLREGVVSRADLERHARPVVLVVCTGNTCRSPMAAELLRAALAREAAREPGLLLPEVGSAGVAAGEGLAATPAAVQALGERGLDLSGHSSRPLDDGLLRRADLVLGLTRGHLRVLQGEVERLELPAGEAPELELFDPGGRPVEDPFGGPLALYRDVAAMLERQAAARAAEITGHGSGTA